VALSFIAQRTLGIHLPFSWYTIVPPAVWALYTLDRIMDVRHSGEGDLSGRHRFTLQHRRVLTALSCVVLAVVFLLAVWQFPASYWLIAMGLGILTASHQLWQRSVSPLAFVIKDVNVAVVYTVGSWSIPIVMHGGLDPGASFVLAAVTTIVLVDVMWLSVIDQPRDARLKAPSIAVALGRRRTMMLARSLSIMVACCTAVWMWYGGRQDIGLTLIAMSGLHFQ
jgi:4-hydroxybenzoate polyprenyltransferase